MGVKFAKAFGAHVVLFTTSPSKVADGKRLGAHEVVISKDEAQMAAHANSFDFILDAVSATHDINAYLNLLKRDGNLTLVGAPEKPLPVASFPLIFRRRSFSGSLIGVSGSSRSISWRAAANTAAGSASERITTLNSFRGHCSNDM